MNKKVLQAHLLKDFADSELLKLPTPSYKAIKAYLSDKELKKIQLAYNFAFHAHDGQLRKDGTAYISHPVAVANILLELKMDVDSICAALMHDVLEDCDVQKNNLVNLFGDDVANIVDGVSKLSNLNITDRLERDANNLQKMALAMAHDVRVILVKLCDRLHNMRTIENLPRAKQIIKSKETLELYGPLALRVGMQDIRAELEDISFKCMHPLRAEMLENAIKSSSGGRKKIVEKIRKELKSHLKTNEIENAAQLAQRQAKKAQDTLEKSVKPTPAEPTEPTPATTDALAGTDNRQRDHTTGREDQSDIEVIETPAPPPADNTEGQEEAQMAGTAEYNDGLPDFGTSPAPKGEEEETGETKTETDENMEQATKDEAEKEEPEPPAANPEYVMVPEANVEQSPTIIA